MTAPADIAAMTDRELDVLVAELVDRARFGHTIPYHANSSCGFSCCFRCERTAPHFISDWNEAARLLPYVEDKAITSPRETAEACALALMREQEAKQ